MVDWRAENGTLAEIAAKARSLVVAAPSLALHRVRTLPAVLRRYEKQAAPVVAAGVGSGVGWLGKSFLLLVVAPTFVFWLYAAFWQSDGYVAEARVTVRAAQEQRGSVSDAAAMIGKLTGGAKNTQQDSFIVLNYIKSHAILVDLGGRAYLEKVYADPDVDYFSRLKTGQKLEELIKYWKGQIVSSVDTVSGILTIQVTAFKPEDSLRVAQDVVRASEAEVNAITVRNRKDALSNAEAEVARSAQKLAEARNNMLQFRNQNVLIDPAARAASIGEMIGKLTLEKIETENSLTALSANLSSEAPSLRIQHGKLDTINAQIGTLKNSLTSLQASDTVSAQLATYERLKLEEQFAEKIYTISQNAYIRARQELSKQQLYLVTVVAPTLPETATFPKVGASTLLLLATLFILWAIGALIAATINDHRD